MKCFGRNHLGQLGQGHTNDLGDEPGEMGDNLPAIDFGAGLTAKAIDVGYSHACAILNNDQVKCWGSNGNTTYNGETYRFNIVWGQLGHNHRGYVGDEPNEMGDNLVAVDLGEGLTAKAISLGAYHTCALLSNDQMKCWGHGSSGQLGYGGSDDVGDEPDEMGDNLPTVDLAEGLTVKAISAGGYHTCALLSNDQVKCWGYNRKGQLGHGHGDYISENIPFINLGEGLTAKSIVAGNTYTCALLNNDQVKCWGYNQQGQLGQGHKDTWGNRPGQTVDTLDPIDLGEGLAVKAIAPRISHTCVLTDKFQLKCFGRNNLGQLGHGHTKDLGDAPGEMGDNLPVTDIGTWSMSLRGIQ